MYVYDYMNKHEHIYLLVRIYHPTFTMLSYTQNRCMNMQTCYVMLCILV